MNGGAREDLSGLQLAETMPTYVESHRPCCARDDKQVRGARWVKMKRHESSSRVSRPAMVRFTYSDTPRGTLVLACNRVLWIGLDGRMAWLKLPVDTAMQACHVAGRHLSSSSAAYRGAAQVRPAVAGGVRWGPESFGGVTKVQLVPRKEALLTHPTCSNTGLLFAVYKYNPGRSSLPVVLVGSTLSL